jgi:hypothetical protein
VNDAARARYGYPVDHWKLPLSENTRRCLSHLVAWFDTSIDWASPTDSDDRWDESELQRFLAAKQRAHELLAGELPPLEFEVVS